MHERGEVPLRADVHPLAASLATTIERGPRGRCGLRVMDRAQPGDLMRESVDALGDRVPRLARWTPSATVLDVPITEIAPDVGHIAQRRWLGDLGDLETAEREVEELLARDPGRPARDIVAAGNALFTIEDLDRWTCSRLSVGGPEWSDRFLRHDRVLVVRSADSEHPLLTTETQLELEQHVFDRASALRRERNPLFERVINVSTNNFDYSNHGDVNRMTVYLVVAIFAPYLRCRRSRSPLYISVAFPWCRYRYFSCRLASGSQIISRQERSVWRKQQVWYSIRLNRSPFVEALQRQPCSRYSCAVIIVLLTDVRLAPTKRDIVYFINRSRATSMQQSPLLIVDIGDVL